MRKLSLSLLAASIALIPSGALAQGHRGGPPAGGGGHVGRPAHGPGMMMRHRGPMMPRHNFPRRMHRGFFVPQFWWGPQFWINNWQGYGFADPGDGRWIRYYDDAYLIGPDGRIRDSREGYDWSRYGEEWEMADDGIPARRGRRHRDDDDDDDDDDEGHAEHRGHHGMHHGGPPMYGPGYGYGGGYSQVYGGGYGYGMYAYPIVIETITTAGATMVTEEVVEEYVSVRRHRPRRARCVCRAPRPAPPPPPRPRRPPPGERG